jgi:adenosylhomocysteine nucleosidase
MDDPGAKLPERALRLQSRRPPAKSIRSVMSKKILRTWSWPSSWPCSWSTSAFSWPGFSSTEESQARWRLSWSGAWSGTRAGDSIEAPDAADADTVLDLAGLSAASVIALVGLAFEARIAAGPGVLVICRGGECHPAEILPMAVRNGCRSIISFGVAGGLTPDLTPGDCVVASAIIDYPTLRPTDPLWSGKLLQMIPDARHGPIVGVNSGVCDPADKHKLHAATGAMAVDMESHLVARLAASHGLSFTSVRVVIDPADRTVPPAALLAMAPGGGTDVSSLLWEILARPSQLAGLMRIAADAYAARAALVRLRRVLGPDFRCR